MIRSAIVVLLAVLLPGALFGAVPWRAVLNQPADWYASAEARAVADTVLLYQFPEGGWPKNRDMTLPPGQTLPQDGKDHHDITAPTIDNDATTMQLHLLARVQALQPDARFQAAIERGLDYLLAAQYENGGWPQFYPLIPGYYTHITFNDDAMVNAMEVLRDVSRQRPPFVGIDSRRRTRAAKAVEKGIACILRCQITVDGVKTAWCAQHDETTFAPAPARKYEHASLSGLETVGILRFFMEEDVPSPEVILAVHAAVAWLEKAKLTGVREERPPNPDLPQKQDRVIVADPAAPPIWARFYEIGTNRPIYGGRDGIIRYNLAEVEPERRGGYNWHTFAPQKLLAKEYPAWAKKWPPPDAGVKEFSRESALQRVLEKYPQASLPADTMPPHVLSSENLTYAVVDGQILQLDLYRPEGVRPGPVVLLVHGGGWETGTRHMERPLAKQLAARGYIAVPVSYRLGQRGRFPAAVDDLKSAIRWLKANATELALEDKAPIGVVGGSAGGQLAALLGAANDADLRIGAVVDIDGLADFTGPALVDQQKAQPSAPVRFLGGNFSDKPEVWRDASAISHVSARSAPTLFINSSAPTPILPGREEMRDKLKTLGIASEIIVTPDSPHPFWLLQPWFDGVIGQIDRFLQDHLAVDANANSGESVELVVAADGSGQFTSIQEAISKAPMHTGARDPRVIIRVKPGTYRERVYVQRERGRMTVRGDDAATTIIAYDQHANLPGPDGKPIGTFRTATVQIDGDGMVWENLTIANTAGKPGPRENAPAVAQALALRVDGDRVTFRGCRFLGWQDTILVNRGRHYFTDCYIEGSVDFIFGAATSYFDRCHIHCVGDGYITAASTPEGAAHGLVFADCKVTGTPGVKTYLGRPWRDFAQTVFLRTDLSEVVRPEGWHNWNKPRAEGTSFYAEIGSQGPGAAGSRAAWAKQLSPSQVRELTPIQVLGGDDQWRPVSVVTLHLAGDSTMANKPDPAYPERGWGQAFRAWVPPSLRLVNHAVNGRSTKSFRDLGHWDNLLALLREGDWVVLQFGHNDARKDDPERYADPAVDYPANLRRFIAEVRAKGAHPVLATPVVRREWSKQGELVNSHQGYPAAARAVAAEEKVPLLDLEAVTRRLVTELGPAASEKLFLNYAPGEHPRLPEGKTDNTHFNEEGARRVAALVLEEMRRIGLPIADTLAAGQAAGSR